MNKIILKPKNLEFQPRPTYPYSPGTKAGNMIYTAGQVAWDSTGKVIGINDIRAVIWITFLIVIYFGLPKRDYPSPIIQLFFGRLLVV